MTERHGTLGLWARQSRVDAPLLALVFAVTGIAAFLLSAGPLALTRVATDELRTTVAELPAVRRDLSATATLGDPIGNGFVESSEQLLAIIQSVLEQKDFEPPLDALLDDPQWVVRSSETSVVPPRGGGFSVEVMRLVLSQDWLSRSSFVAGRAPVAWTSADAEAVDPIEVAVSMATAEAYGVGVGDLLDASPAPLVVSGVYEPDGAGDPFWAHLPAAVEPAQRRADDGRRIVSADVFVDPASLDALRDTFAAGALDAWYPLDVAGLRFADATETATRIRQAAVASLPLPTGGVTQINPALADDIDAVTERVGVASALFALIAAGPLGVMLAVVALGVRSVLDRRARALRLVGARGADGVALRVGLAAEGALLAVPAAAVGVAAAALVGGGMPALWPAAVVAVSAPALLALGLPLRRDGAESTARWVAEVLVVGLAVVSVFLLVRRGVVAQTAGIDPLLAAAPLLVAAAVSVGVLRVYPLAMRGVQRISHARRGPVAVVGSARAVRAPALGFAASFALVVGLSIATFSAALGVTFVRAFAVGSADRDATFDATNPLAVALQWLLGIGVVVPLIFCGCAVAIAAVAAARERGGAVAVMRVLGFSPAQVRGLVGWEFAPVAAVAGAAGALLGAVEVVVLGAALDLPGLLGRPAPVTADAAVTGAIVTVFAAVTIVTAWAATAAARRPNAASTLRMGTE